MTKKKPSKRQAVKRAPSTSEAKKAVSVEVLTAVAKGLNTRIGEEVSALVAEIEGLRKRVTYLEQNVMELDRETLKRPAPSTKGHLSPGVW